MWYYHQPLLNIQQDDSIHVLQFNITISLIPQVTKKGETHKNQMSLVEVPCWWDGEIQRYVNHKKIYLFNALAKFGQHHSIS
jgi:hypothetical protein